jgi:hypothetical protein
MPESSHNAKVLMSTSGGAGHLRYFKNLLTLAVETPATVRSCAAEVVLSPR